MSRVTTIRIDWGKAGWWFADVGVLSWLVLLLHSYAGVWSQTDGFWQRTALTIGMIFALQMLFAFRRWIAAKKEDTTPSAASDQPRNFLT
jgi:hypothetical protein